MAKKILIAEDDRFLVRMYKLHLDAEDDFAVNVAFNGDEAMEQMDKDQPDLLLLDILMPKEDGFAVLEHIKKKKYSFPVIILTNLSEEVDRNKCMDMGATDYYVKADMDINDLVDMVKKHV